ncbi:MAG: Iron-sulfur cluster repair di-iron protein [Fibrobacteres bacterium]|nr:Iron-sulfur cluster repair di-iron protein [Fibrobacterota bacterium]
MKNMLSRQTPVRALLKMRPMAIGMLDKRKIRYWDSLDKPLGDLFHQEGMDDFLDEVSYARVPAPDTDWSAMPLYMLVEYLTQEHRGLLLQEVGDISHLLDIHTLSDSPESADLRKLQRAFQDWVKEFQGHIDQEETYLFPKVLRYEACLRDRNVHPEFHHGSIQSYMASLEAQEGRQFYADCGDLADRMGAHERKHPDSMAARELAELTERLRDKLNAHRDLESKTLYTAARDLERSLYNKSIDGDPAVAFQRRGPMDSGILRLDEG